MGNGRGGKVPLHFETFRKKVVFLVSDWQCELHKICLRFGFADVIQSSKKSRFQQTIEAAVRDPSTPPRSTLGSRPTGWEPLGLRLNRRFDQISSLLLEKPNEVS